MTSTEPNPDQGRWPRSALITVGALLVITLASLAVTLSVVLSDDPEPLQYSRNPEEVVEEQPEPDPQTTFKLGQATQIETYDTVLEVQPAKFFRSLSPAFVDLDPSQKLVGALINFRNVGDAQYSMSIWQDVMLVDSNSRQWPVQGVPDEAGPCAPRLETVNLSPGMQRKGCFPFTLPKDVKPKAIQVAPDAGSSQNFSLWRIPNPG